MSTIRTVAVSVCLVLGTLAAVSARADAPPAPPEEAFTACQSKTAGDACVAPMPGHAEEGVCTAAPGDGRLFCRPKAPPGPPPEAFSACDGKSEADQCTVKFGDRTMDGACMKGPDGRLACAPPRR